MAETRQIPDDEFDFANFLAEFAKGTTNKVASERMRELVKACMEYGRKGTLTIKIDVGVAGGVAELRASVSTKKPDAALPGGIYFTTEDGALVEEDPRQMKLQMPAKVIDVQPLRTVGKES